MVNTAHTHPEREGLMTNTLGFDAREVSLVTLDLGHTLIWPDYYKLAQAMTEYFDMPITAAMVCDAEIKFRRDLPAFYTENHATVAIPQNAYNYYAALVSYCLSQPVHEFADHFREFAIEAHRYHMTKNWFMVLGNDAIPALKKLSRMFHLGVISNAHGTLERDLKILGIRQFFDFVTDSELEGCSKPDPKIFLRSLMRADVLPEHAVHVGDQPVADVGGAQAAGMHAILFDAQGVFGDFSSSVVPRFSSLMDVANALVCGKIGPNL